MGSVSTAVKLLSAKVCWHTMKRTTVKISDDLDARLRHEAERRGVTVFELQLQPLESQPRSRTGRPAGALIADRRRDLLLSELVDRMTSAGGSSRPISPISA